MLIFEPRNQKSPQIGYLPTTQQAARIKEYLHFPECSLPMSGAAPSGSQSSAGQVTSAEEKLPRWSHRGLQLGDLGKAEPAFGPVL